LGELVECRLGRTKLDLESIAKSVWPETLEVLALYSSSRKWNARMREAFDLRGYREFP